MTKLSKTSKFRSLEEAEIYLDSCVVQFNNGMEQFAAGIKDVRDSKLYLQKEGVTTFAQYCNDRWGRTIRTVQRALNAHETRENLLGEATPDQRPAIRAKTTRQINDIAKLPKEKQVEAAAAVVVPAVSKVENLLVIPTLPEAAVVPPAVSMEHLTIGRVPSKATHVSDFYSSPNPMKAAPTPVVPLKIPETEDSVVARRLRSFALTQGPDYQDYLAWLADQFKKEVK